MPGRMEGLGRHFPNEKPLESRHGRPHPGPGRIPQRLRHRRSSEQRHSFKLNEGADFPIEQLTDPAENQLSEWLAKTIITNEEQIRNRRNEFVKLPTL